MGESFLPSLIFFRSEANVGVLLGQQHQPRNPENVLGLATLDEEQREFFPPLIHELACLPHFRIGGPVGFLQLAQ